MAVHDLADVTRSLLNLLQHGFSVYGGGQPAPQILPEPPVRLTGDGLGMYLYHVQEDKTIANMPQSGIQIPEMRFMPMALQLFYQLSANSTADSNPAFLEQFMMGIAMKTLHDYPAIDDNTVINGTAVFIPTMIGKGNRIKINLLPVPYKEAVNFWTAGATPMRLAAYYEVAIVFLEPEQTTSYSGRVLTYGNYIFSEGTPRITGSQSTLAYLIPPGNTPASVNVQPAQAPPGIDIRFFGSGFNGDQVLLQLMNTAWAEPAITTPAWNVNMSAMNQITATIQTQALIERTNTPIDIIPGMYSAQVIVIRNRVQPNGELKQFRFVSNQFPFVITPRIDNLVFVGSTLQLTGYVFPHPEATSDRIEVYVGEHRMTRQTQNPQPGEFSTTSTTTMEIESPGGLSGQVLPIRIIINGAESPPHWITIP